MTCDPGFYKDTQRLFLSLFEKGLAYQSEALVNWDPIDRTVLANEQVDANGFSWRSDAKVEPRWLKQWFVKITEYAESLLQDLQFLEKDHRWPLHVVSMQRNWLGKSEGSILKFKLHCATHRDAHCVPQEVEVFTTRADTLCGVQYVGLSTDHPVVQDLAETNSDLQSFIDSSEVLGPESKAGFLIPSLFAQNPLTAVSGHGFDNSTVSDMNRIPVFVAPYVRSDYGSGAVMGVPAHDSRDLEFWHQNTTNHPLNPVIRAEQDPTCCLPETQPLTEYGYLTDKCGKFEGLHSEAAIREVVSQLSSRDPALARFTVNWRLRDWLISRQRYWGCPIPIIHCRKCGPVPVPDDHLPVKLPHLRDEQWKGMTGNPLEQNREWYSTSCPQCGSDARRETDTMDTFVDSSWYYLRFAQLEKNPSERTAFMPVDLYIGGVEHAILHLLYARFIHKFLARENSTYFDVPEPFKRLLTQGMVHGKTFSDPESGRFLKPDELDHSQPKVTIRSTGKSPNITFEKMSKSRFNGVDPVRCMQTYGTDVTRAHVLFQAPPTEVLDWDLEKIVGIQRWYGRIWSLVQALKDERFNSKGNKSIPHPTTDHEIKLYRALQSTIASVNQSFSETLALNTVVSDLMGLTNEIQQSHKDENLPRCSTTLLSEALRVLLRLMVPIAPSFAEECWQVLNRLKSSDEDFSTDHTASLTRFPQIDGAFDGVIAESQMCAVQVNGKLKFALSIPTASPDLSPQDLQVWTVSHVRESKEWSQLASKSDLDIDTAKRIIVARGGRILNVVF